MSRVADRCGADIYRRVGCGQPFVEDRREFAPVVGREEDIVVRQIGIDLIDAQQQHEAAARGLQTRQAPGCSPLGGQQRFVGIARVGVHDHRCGAQALAVFEHDTAGPSAIHGDPRDRATRPYLDA